MGALRLPTLQGTLVFGMVGALRLPTLQGTLVFGMVGALRLPTLREVGVGRGGCAALTHPTEYGVIS